jgi:nitrate/TMAO reductase-like tetraheme cytochrome c subunit
MNKRECDKCHKIIERGSTYLKVSEVINGAVKNHKGDLCINCWDEIIK